MSDSHAENRMSQVDMVEANPRDSIHNTDSGAYGIMANLANHQAW